MFAHRLRVRWADTDASGRIHNSVAFRYFEEAEAELFRHLGLRLEPMRASRYDFPRVHVECDYLQPLGFDDELAIQVRVGRLGTTSFTLEYEALLVGEGPHRADLTGGAPTPLPVPALRGRVVIVTVERATGRPAPIPPELRAALEAYRMEAPGSVSPPAEPPGPSPAIAPPPQP
ncbi:MAG: acyl-CoA thioesterase [Clostridia bacterium]|nr:acyl-CoA thioesterase [Clostridia bacterium]